MITLNSENNPWDKDDTLMFLISLTFVFLVYIFVK